MHRIAKDVRITTFARALRRGWVNIVRPFRRGCTIILQSSSKIRFRRSIPVVMRDERDEAELVGALTPEEQ